MRYLLLSSVVIVSFLSVIQTAAQAQSLEIGGIYYRIIDSTKVEVSRPPIPDRTPNTLYRGCIVIPAKVIYNDVTYSVASIGINAFSLSDSLTSVVIPNSVTSIKIMAFIGCRKLESVSIPNSVTSIQEMAFGDCSDLTSVAIPNSVISMDAFAFSGCTGLTSINIPDSITYIEIGAFMECRGLKSIIIPNLVNRVASGSFSGCNSLTSVTCLASVPPRASNFWGGMGFEVNKCTLFVPARSKKLYQAAEGWKDFLTIRALANNK